MNLNDNIRVRTMSATGTPIHVKGSINHRKANASCSGVVVVRQRLALWKTFYKNKHSYQNKQMLVSIFKGKTPRSICTFIITRK